MNYKPQGKTKEILDWCLSRVQSVDYRVTARWLFYRFVEEVLKPSGMSVKTAKKQYKTFLQWTSRARKRFYNGWSPNTLVDDTRYTRERGFGFSSEERWVDHFEREKCVLDKYLNQSNILEIWFEAEAMYSQFDYYTSPYHLTLRPFKGDPSIDYKAKIAKDLEYLGNYKKPIIVLYFGDYDQKGVEIPENALRDIRAWSKTPFKFFRCGINKEQIVEWGMIESFDKEGTYQWEALSEDKAKALILGYVEKYWSLDKIQEVEEKEREATERWKDFIQEAIKRI